MTDPENKSFSYEAQGSGGQRLTGIVEAIDADSAMQRLEAMHLKVIRFDPVAPPATARALRGDDFVAFNEQLAQLAKAGLPLERGLRLVAADLYRGRLAKTISQIADELDRGLPLREVFEKRPGQFPAMYGRLVEAGVQIGNLSGVLLGLSRHMELVQRLRANLWRTISYPLMVFIGLCLVLIFLGWEVVPGFQSLLQAPVVSYGPKGTVRPLFVLPPITRAVFATAHFAPYLLVGIVVLFVALPMLWILLRAMGLDRQIVEAFVLPLPLIGPVLRKSMIARWCDALRLGVEAGLDLPAAILLAGDASGSPALLRDGLELVAQLEAGKPLERSGRVLPATVPATIHLASGYRNLPEALGTLAELYQRQAEMRMAKIPIVLTPLLMILIAGSIGFVILGLMAPLLKILDALGGL